MKNKTILRLSSLKLSFLACALLLSVYPATTLAVTLYKWIDDEGNVSYQDTPPPAGQKYEERSFSDEGARTGDTNAEVALSRAVQENPVMLYLADNCDSCDLVVRILESNNVPFETTEVGTDAEAQKELIELVGSIRVPTLTIGDKIIDGSNRATIEDALARNGYPKAPAVPQ